MPNISHATDGREGIPLGNSADGRAFAGRAGLETPPPVLRGRDNAYGPRSAFHPSMRICRAAWRHWTDGDVTQAAVEIDGEAFIAWTWWMDVDAGWQPDHLAGEVMAALGGWLGRPCDEARVAIAPAEAALFRAAAANPRIEAWRRDACLRTAAFSQNGDRELLRHLSARGEP